MLCERCRIREANIKYTEVINGVKTEHNLCAQCAKEMDFGPYSAIFDGEFPLAKLLSGLLGIGEETQEEKSYKGIVCPVCKTSYDDFVEKSRFGCQDCYSVFDPLIRDNIKKIQGSDRHVGKVPKFQAESIQNQGEETEKQGPKKELTPEEKIAMLQARLKEALQREEYEEAAVCRDEIRQLKEAAQENSGNGMDEKESETDA